MHLWDGELPPHARNATSEGEQYRERLDSLRNFVNAKRQKELNGKSRQQPRSWVRGKSPSVQSSTFELSRDRRSK